MNALHSHYRLTERLSLHRLVRFQREKRHNTVWSRRPPLRFKLLCLAREGGGDSGEFCQRRWVGAAHTNR